MRTLAIGYGLRLDWPLPGVQGNDAVFVARELLPEPWSLPSLPRGSGPELEVSAVDRPHALAFCAWPRHGVVWVATNVGEGRVVNESCTHARLAAFSRTPLMRSRGGERGGSAGESAAARGAYHAYYEEYALVGCGPRQPISTNSSSDIRSCTVTPVRCDRQHLRTARASGARGDQQAPVTLRFSFSRPGFDAQEFAQVLVLVPLCAGRGARRGPSCGAGAPRRVAPVARPPVTLHSGRASPYG